jgi:hypothetical protein
MVEPTQRHKQVVEKIRAYINSLFDHGLFYPNVVKDRGMKLHIYIWMQIEVVKK